MPMLILSGFYLMSMWYKRAEAQRRFSFFVSAATFAGAFGGLLATGIGHMDGIRGYHAYVLPHGSNADRPLT
jgi:hypothetical protein